MATLWQKRLLPRQHASAWQRSLALVTSHNIYISCAKIIFMSDMTLASFAYIAILLVTVSKVLRPFALQGRSVLLASWHFINQLLSQLGHWKPHLVFWELFTWCLRGQVRLWLRLWAASARGVECHLSSVNHSQGRRIALPPQIQSSHSQQWNGV